MFIDCLFIVIAEEDEPEKSQPFDAFADFTKMMRIAIHAKAKADAEAEEQTDIRL